MKALACCVVLITLSAAEKVALTPPMGWNSWDCYGTTVTEAEVKANADYMAKHLKKPRLAVCGGGHTVVGESTAGAWLSR